MSSFELDGVLTRAQLKKYVPYSDTHLRRLEAKGLFPSRIRLGPGRVCWLTRQILEWLELKKAESALSREGDKNVREA